MAIIDETTSWDESIAFIISPEGEIRSLTSPPPLPHRQGAVSFANGRGSQLKRKSPRQDLRKETHEIRYSDTQHSTSEPSSSDISDDRTKGTHQGLSTPELDQEGPVTRVALQIAQSTFVQSSLQRRYWDPPLSPFNIDLEAHRQFTPPDGIARTVALTDVNIPGDPIRMCTSDFDAGPRGLKVGTCLFLNLPYGANDACGLQVKMKNGTATDWPRFILEVAAVVLDTGTGKKRWRLCTQHDVTDVINDMARSRLTSGNTTSDEEPPSASFAPQVGLSSSSGHNFFDWTAFAEEEFRVSLRNTPQPADPSQQQSRPESLTPSHHSHQSGFRLSGSTLVPSTSSTPMSAARSFACFSNRSTLVAPSPTPLPRGQRVTRHPVPTPASPLFTSIPQDIQQFLRLAHTIRRAHAGLFFILVPLHKQRSHYHSVNTKATPAEQASSSASVSAANTGKRRAHDRNAIPILLNHSVDFLSAELREAPGLLERLVRAGNGQEGSASLRAGLRSEKTFIWEVSGGEKGRKKERKKERKMGDAEAECEGRKVVCVPVGDGGRERWWVCFPLMAT